uniref:Methyltransferase small domain-containing protein n=1 Tax=Rhizochromulina marina TaxID=1034831 RepID=A0A7S2RZC6_9STRA
MPGRRRGQPEPAESGPALVLSPTRRFAVLAVAAPTCCRPLDLVPVLRSQPLPEDPTEAASWMSQRLGQRVTCDLVNRRWRLFQLKKGHRFSNDDLFTAWRAALAHPSATRLLDLGCGIGSVGLSTLFKVGSPTATLVGIEAQEASHALLTATLSFNGLAGRVTALHGDLRDLSLIRAEERFDLITGSPPYLPCDSGVLSNMPQKAACRIELRGDVYDYCSTARYRLAPNGRFCFVMLAQDPRTEDAVRVNHMTILERWDYTFKPGRKPHICTLVCAREEDVAPDFEPVHGSMLIRDEAGDFTEEHFAFKRHMMEVCGFLS